MKKTINLALFLRGLIFYAIFLAKAEIGDEMIRGALFSTVFANRTGCKKPID
jgi:hypothetical protein